MPAAFPAKLLPNISWALRSPGQAVERQHLRLQPRPGQRAAPWPGAPTARCPSGRARLPGVPEERCGAGPRCHNDGGASAVLTNCRLI